MTSGNAVILEPKKPLDRYAIARRDFLGRLEGHVTAAVRDKRPWEGVVYPLGLLMPHPLAPGGQALVLDGSFIVAVPVALIYRPLPDRTRFATLWKSPAPPSRVFMGADGVPALREFLDEELKRADDGGKPWYASVCPMGAWVQPDPREYHKRVVTHDGSFVVLVLVGTPRDRLPHPEHLKVWWRE